ncbi:unnamed protein product [Rhizophagus irregularis]|nr:unnamed protein product [Rhizophagus irregularis]
MDNVKSLAYSDNHDLYSFSSYSEPFNENLSLYSQLFNINSLSHKLLPSELFSKPSDLLAEPLFKLLSKLPSEPQPPFKQPSELILSKPLFEIPFGPLSEIPSEPLSEIPSELLPEIPFEPLPEVPSKLLPGLLSEPLSEPLPEPRFETYFELDENIDSLEQPNNYQYNLAIGDTFDNWESVNIFMHQYCLERGCNYEAQKIIDQKSHRLCGTIKTNCEWHYCKVAPIVTLEMLKKKYPQHVFHKQDVYNTIYKLCQSNNHEKSSDSTSLLDTLFEKVSQNPTWKVFVRHSDNYGRFQNVANALVEDELSSTYLWILKCLMKATDNIIPKSIWMDFEPELINAISQVFPNTQHFLCLFHIWQNIIKHLKTPLGSNFNNFSKAFYSCKNSLSIEIFEQRWEFMIKTFPECQRYMIRILTLCDVQEAIDKRHKEEIKYCQLVDLKAKYTTIGLPHISSQFFSSVDVIIVKFLTPLMLSLQQFQISQSFTYEGQIAPEDLNLQSNTLNDNFIEDVIDEPQTTLKSLLDGMDTSSIIVEVWKIRRIGGLSCKENLVALFSDGTYICTCMETITKGIVWYKDEILMKLDVALENSPIIKAIESSSEATTVPLTVDFTLQTLQHLQGLFHNKENVQRIIP